MKKILAYLVIFLLVITAGYLWLAKSGGFAADIRGTITNVTTSGAVTHILIEGTKETGTQYDKAAVKVTEKTIIEDLHGRDLAPQHLVQGAKVEAAFTGPVMESYPVQATAEKIIVFVDLTP